MLAALAARGLDSPQATASKVEAAIDATAELDFGLSASDIRSLARRIGPEELAMIVLFENVWEQKLKEIAGKYGGSVASQRLIAPEALRGRHGNWRSRLRGCDACARRGQSWRASP